MACSLVGNVIMGIVWLFKENDLNAFPLVMGMGLFGTFFGSFFGCWLPVLLYAAAEKRNGAWCAGVVTVAAVVSVASIPMGLHMIRSAG